MKVSELKGAGLDYWVAKAEGFGFATIVGDCVYVDEAINEFSAPYATDWFQIGPLIEREKISIGFGTNDCSGKWYASIDKPGSDYDMWELCGPTPLIAAMRCYVASKYGEEVDED